MENLVALLGKQMTQSRPKSERAANVGFVRIDDYTSWLRLLLIGNLGDGPVVMIAKICGVDFEVATTALKGHNSHVKRRGARKIGRRIGAISHLSSHVMYRPAPLPDEWRWMCRR